MNHQPNFAPIIRQNVAHSRILVVAIFTMAIWAAKSSADIFRWEYVNPADPSQGKQQSSTLALDGAGVNAVPGADLWNRNLTMAYLIGSDLQGASATFATLTNADLGQANLTNARFDFATLMGTNFTDAIVQGAIFFDTDLSTAQLYSTASYKAYDLTRIGLGGNGLSGANFMGQNLSNAYFDNATLTGANFGQANLTGAYLGSAIMTGANVADAIVQWTSFSNYEPFSTGLTTAQLYSTASYLAYNLTGIDLGRNDLSGANFTGQNLTYAHLYDAELAGANFSQANLTNVTFISAALTDANFADTTVQGANFGDTNLSTVQLYSTASYTAHDLAGIGLGGNDLSGWNFSGQNLTNAFLSDAQLTGANFTDAIVRGAIFSRLNIFGAGLTTAQLYSTDSYQAHDLTGIGLAGHNLSGADLAGQNLTNADFGSATLTAADFTGAVVEGANYSQTTSQGFTAAQLYSTVSYQSHDLAGIGLGSNNLTDWNFSGQNLTGANFFYSTLSNANFRDANLINSYLDGATLNGADFTAADLRGATVSPPNDSITTNLIRPDGHITGLDLSAGQQLVVRDYDGDPGRALPPIAIYVGEHFLMSQGGTLTMLFEMDAWDSTISFYVDTPVTLGGTLELTFEDDVILASQVGRTFDLFDWTGVNPAGTFAVSSPYVWDVSNLYTTGKVTLVAVPEPGSTSLLFGVAALGALARRRSLSPNVLARNRSTSSNFNLNLRKKRKHPMRFLYVAVCACLIGSSASFSQASISFGPSFDGHYVSQNLGTPSGFAAPAGGLTLLAGDPNKLLIGGSANSPSGAIYSVDLIRGLDGHITGFAGPATVYASAPYIDGGLAYGPGGVLFYTRFNVHQLGQIEPGSVVTDRWDNITGFGGVGNSVGSLAFVPDGFAGAGELKAVTFQQGSFGTIPLSPDGNGTYAPGAGILEATLSGGPEGIAYVKGGNFGFAADSLLVAEYSNGMVGTYTLDSDGNPIPSTRREFITGLNGVEGAFVDPLTGDFLFSTFSFSQSEVFVVRGFTPPDGVVPEATSVVVWLGLALTGTVVRRRRR